MSHHSRQRGCCPGLLPWVVALGERCGKGWAGQSPSCGEWPKMRGERVEKESLVTEGVTSKLEV